MLLKRCFLFLFQIRANDPLSHSICDKCFEELEVFDMYIKICETAQKIMWATYLNEKNATKNQVVKKVSLILQSMNKI